MILEGFHFNLPFQWVAFIFFVQISHGSFSQNSFDNQNITALFQSKSNSLPPIKKENLNQRSFLKEWKSWQNRFLNNGYPFAISRLDTIQYENNIRISIITDPGPPVFFGPLILEVDTVFNKGMLARWLRIRETQPFSQEIVERIPQMLDQLPMATAVKKPKLEWFGEKAILHLYLVKRRNNAFSGILGVLPQGNNGAAIITGNIDGSLKNLFGRALSLDIKWNRFAPSSQMAQVRILQEALSYNGLGLDVQFDLFRQDSTLNRQRFEFRLLTSPFGLWKYFVGIHTMSASSRLGPNSDSYQKVDQKGLSFQVVFEPQVREGIQVKYTRFIGTLKPGIKTGFSGGTEKQFPQLESHVSCNLPIVSGKNRWALQGSLSMGGIFCNQVLVPDQFRVGGFQNLRGFNENQFFTTQHLILGLQQRYLLDQNLLVYGFGQTMAYNTQPIAKKIWQPNWAHSFGLGLEIQAGNNEIQIVFANGFTKDFPFDIQTTKIHFGYVARF